jgi:purine-binding chemotaxis protein CheW
MSSSEEVKNKENDVYVNNIEQHQYLTFILSGEVFGVSVLSVKEIIGYGNITKVPSTKSFVFGVTNVRGNVVPVISLAERFGMPADPVTSKTCIIIVSVIIDDDATDVGIIVDRVNQVYDILPQTIEETPSFGTKIRKDFIDKIGKVDGQFISILNNETILNIEELAQTIERRNLRRRSDD